MLDAVIDEIDGRRIRIGDHWLYDFASCNYLGLDLDDTVIQSVLPYLEKWGTHPSWSRLLGSPVIYEEIEAKLTKLWAPKTCSPCRPLPTSICRSYRSLPGRARSFSTAAPTRRSMTVVKSPAITAPR